MRCHHLLFGLLASLVAPALADPPTRTHCSGFTGERGLPGSFGLVDARPVELQLVGRGGLRWGLERDQSRLSAGAPRRIRADRNEAQLVGGVSAPPVDLGGRISWRFLDRRTKPLPPSPARGAEDLDVDGRGDLEVAARVTVPWFLDDYVCLAPFGAVRIPTARTEVEEPAFGEAGLALDLVGGLIGDLIGEVGDATLTPALLANVVARHEERGVSSFVYRLGLQLTLVTKAGFAARLYGYAEGEEPEGPPTSDLDIVAGLQVSAWEHIQFDMGFSWGVLEGGGRGRALRELQAALGSTERHVEQRRVAATVGLTFTF